MRYLIKKDDFFQHLGGIVLHAAFLFCFDVRQGVPIFTRRKAVIKESLGKGGIDAAVDVDILLLESAAGLLLAVLIEGGQDVYKIVGGWTWRT